ncbi:MAG: hypothetical protein J6K32_11505 [Clostridia bacterium]|nr:hypothetical protein [Clostridia bacterium]
MRRLLTVLLGLCVLMGAYAKAEAGCDPVSAWTIREVDTFAQPLPGAEDGGMLAASCKVQWLDTQDGWAHVIAQGGLECYVPEDALTLDRVFDFSGLPANCGEWFYDGELRISPDGGLILTISIRQEKDRVNMTGEAELVCFEVIDAETDELICRAYPEQGDGGPVYRGEGILAGGAALVVRPMYTHDGYAVSIEW